MKFAIVVPSHCRPGRITGLLALLPTAIISVEEGQAEAYGAVVDQDHLLVHPKIHGMGGIRHWICSHFKAAGVDCLAMLDDDLKCVHGMVHAKLRTIVDPDILLMLLENSATIISDLGILLGGFAVAGTRQMYYSNCDPISLNKWLGQVYVINLRLYGQGTCFDELMDIAEDDDFSLKALCNSRVIIKDERFWWDFGEVMGNAGGLQTKRTQAMERESHRRLKERWKGSVACELDSAGHIVGVKVSVNRKNSLSTA